MGKPVNKVSRKLSKKMNRVVSGSDDNDTSETNNDATLSTSGVPTQAVPADIPAEVHLQTRRERLLKKIYAKKSADKEGGAKKKRAERSTESTIVTKDATAAEGGAAKSAKRREVEALGRQALAKVAKEPPMQMKTSLNLKTAVRHDMFVRELNLFHHVSQNPAFVEDPFGAIQQHLDSTMKKLAPQTADVGRRPKPAPGTSNYGSQQFRQQRFPPRR